MPTWTTNDDMTSNTCNSKTPLAPSKQSVNGCGTDMKIPINKSFEYDSILERENLTNEFHQWEKELFSSGMYYLLGLINRLCTYLHRCNVLASPYTQQLLQTSGVALKIDNIL